MARLTCALGPDNAGRLVLEAVRAAQQSIDASVYEVGGAYAWAFTEAAARGVVVRLVVDPRSDPEMRGRAVAMSGEGVECRLLALTDSYLHSKLLVIDESRVGIGSGNLNGRDLPYEAARRGSPLAGTREWWAMTDGAPTLAKAARAHVLHNWRLGSPAIGVTGDEPESVAPPVHPLSPEVALLELDLAPRRMRLAGGGSGVRALELELLSGVRKRAFVIVPYVNAASPAVAELLGALTVHARRGIDVRLLLGQPPSSASDIATLGHIEAPVRVMDSRTVVTSTTGHAKGMVCDAVAMVGSANWSEAGLSGNDEAALAISHPDAAAYFAAAFERDWELAIPLSELPAPV